MTASYTGLPNSRGKPEVKFNTQEGARTLNAQGELSDDPRRLLPPGFNIQEATSALITI